MLSVRGDGWVPGVDHKFERLRTEKRDISVSQGC